VSQTVQRRDGGTKVTLRRWSAEGGVVQHGSISARATIGDISGRRRTGHGQVNAAVRGRWSCLQGPSKSRHPGQERQRTDQPRTLHLYGPNST